MEFWPRGRDALVPIILDGENAWEYYEQNGRPFFRELYSRIQNDRRMEAITVQDAFARIHAEPLDHIFPGSWINANFDIWIGAEEDNKAWRLLLNARQAYDQAVDVPEERRKLAFTELLISEGSDWNWWYGPEHDSANRIEFDQIYREHLANVYRALGIPAPPELSVPILKTEVVLAAQTSPSSPVNAKINGRVDSYFEWMGAGVFRVDSRQGAMHGKRELVKQLRFGTDGSRLCILVEFTDEPLEGVQVSLASRQAGVDRVLAVEFAGGLVRIASGVGEAAYVDVLEMAVPISGEEHAEFQLSFWQNGLPVEAVPPQEMLRVQAAEPASWNA